MVSQPDPKNTLIFAVDVFNRGLKRRVRVKKKDASASTNPPGFIEVNLEPPAAVSECIVEMQDILGSKMRMHFRGKTDFDLLQLAKAFWSKKP